MPFLIVTGISIILMISYTKAGLHIFFNQAHSPFFDVFFKYLTHLGDGTMIAILFIVLLFVKYRYAFVFLSGSLSTALFINILKKIVFSNVYRPSKYFELFENYNLHVVEGVKLHAIHSFPSGHTGTAFNVFLMLALLSKNNVVKSCCYAMAALTAYSRIYLSQHFLIDVVAGSIIGITFVLMFHFWFEKGTKKWLNNSLIRKQHE